MIYKISFTANNPRATMDAFKTRAYDGQRTPHPNEYNPRVTTGMKIGDAIHSATGKQQARVYHDRMEKTLPLHKIANDYNSLSSFLNNLKTNVVADFKSQREDLFLKEQELISCNTAENYYSSAGQIKMVVPNRDVEGAFDVIYYDKKVVPNYLSGTSYKLTRPSLCFEDAVMLEDANTIVGANRIYDFRNKVELNNYSSYGAYYHVSSLHAFAPEKCGDGNNLGFISKIGKPMSLYGATIKPNKVEADYLVLNTLDTAKNVKVARVYINPVISYGLDANNQEVLSIDAQTVYETPLRRVRGFEKKFYENVHEEYHNPSEFTSKAQNALEFRDDGAMVDCYVGYEYDSNFGRTAGRKSSGNYFDAINFKYC